MATELPPFEERLHKAICAGYDTESLEQMVRFRLNEKLALVAPKGGRLDVVVFELIQWADLKSRMVDLVRCAAEYNATNTDLAGLRQEFDSRPKPAPAVKPLPGVAQLPDELVKLIQGYERIPAVSADGPTRAAMMEQIVGQIRALQLGPLGLPDRFHLSEAVGERLAAVVALEQSPDERYLRWLAERVTVESLFVGYTAALGLTSAAHVLDGQALNRVRANALEGSDRLAGSSDGAKRRTQLLRAVHVADRRTGTMSSLPEVPFDEIAHALSEAFTPIDLQSLLKAKLDVALESLVGLKNRIEFVVYYLLVTADQAGWDQNLIKVAVEARPKSGKLVEIAAKYAAAGLGGV